MKTEEPVAGPLSTWSNLNARIREASETECEALLAAELSFKRRKQYMLRIHSRLNRMRAIRERSELIKKAL